MAVLESLLSFTCLLIAEVKSEPPSVAGYSITEEKRKRKKKQRKEGREGGEGRGKKEIIVLINLKKGN